MVVVIDSSAPGRVARFRPAWRKCMAMTRRPTSTLGSLVCMRLTPLVNKIERSSTAQHRCQRHHPQKQLCDCGRHAPKCIAFHAANSMLNKDTDVTQGCIGSLLLIAQLRVGVLFALARLLGREVNPITPVVRLNAQIA